MEEIHLLPTGVDGLDMVLGGGLPLFSLNILAGAPGTGKTILVQQMLFNHVRATQASTALYLTTLSEPAVKVVRYMQHFTFFDAALFGERVLYQDIGRIIRDQPLTHIIDYIVNLVDEHHPALLAIDSFRAIRDLCDDPGTFRRFCYDLSVRLAMARCTTICAGEYDRSDIAGGTEFAIADGILFLDMIHQAGEQRRVLQILKMRGRATDMAPRPFVIASAGIRLLHMDLRPSQVSPAVPDDIPLSRTGIAGLDALLYGGIPRGHSVLLCGVSGAGKTSFALEFLVHGAEQGEKGLLFSFDESAPQLYQMAARFGWDLAALEAKGLVRLVSIPLGDIRLEEHVQQMMLEVMSFAPRRFVVDSLSMLLYRVEDPAIQREKVVQLATLVQQQGIVGLFVSDTIAGDVQRLSRFGVEETVVDGTIILSTELVDLERRRYLEVFKMRRTTHVVGRHRFEIGPQGLQVYYFPLSTTSRDSQRPLHFATIANLIEEPLTFGTSWLVLGEAGAGKSILSSQFAADGLQQGESVLYIAMQETPRQIRSHLAGFSIDSAAMERAGRLCILAPFPDGDIDPEDLQKRRYRYLTALQALSPPVRIIKDPMTSIAFRSDQSGFLSAVDWEIRHLVRHDTVFLATLDAQALAPQGRMFLIALFDAVLELSLQDWGEMGHARQRFRMLQIYKARGGLADLRPYPYTIRSDRRIILQEGFYGEAPGMR